MLRSSARALAALAFALGPYSAANASPNASAVDWPSLRQGPKSSASVLWVGHSLVEAKAKSDGRDVDLMRQVGEFAAARGLAYELGDHTLWGTPLSGLWRGKPHASRRDSSEMAPKRKAFEAEARRYDTVVATEALPLGVVMRMEYSAYYLRNFYCALKFANPAGRVYVYQTWVHLHGSDKGAGYPPAHLFDWRAEMVAQRQLWDDLADAVRAGDVQAPPWQWLTRDDSRQDCDVSEPVFTVPVGQAMILLHDRLASPAPADDFVRADGLRFALSDLFSNPYEEAERNPSAEAARRPRDPARDLDDIHPSADGIYFNALVHFATIYRQSPVGLPYPARLGPGLARTLQCLAWEAVVSDPRSGVAGSDDAACR
jgi:hypothetical protein